MVNRTHIWRMVVQFSLMIFISLLLTALINGFFIKPYYAKREFLSYLANKTYCVNNSISQAFDHLFRDINLFAFDPAIVNVSDQITVFSQNQSDTPMAPSKGSTEERYLFTRFSNYATTHPNVVYVYLATQYGGYLTWPETKIPALYNPTKRSWYQAALGAQGRIETTEPYTDLVTSKTIISNAVAVYSPSGEAKGVVGIDIELSGMITSLQSQLEQNSPQMGLENIAKIYLVHRSGTVLYDSNAPQNNMLNLANIDKALWQDFNATIIANNNLLPRDQGSNSSSFSELIQSQGTKTRYMGMAAVGTPENDWDWWLIVTASKTEINDILAPSLFKVLVFVWLLILLTGVLLSILYNLLQAKSALNSRLSQSQQILLETQQSLIDQTQISNQSKNQLQNLSENIPGIVFRCYANAPWKMVTMNGYVNDITGYPTSDFTGPSPLHTWGELVHPEDFPMVAASTTKEINSIYNLEYRILTESGEVKWVSEYGRHIDDPYTGAHLIDGIILDIDHKKRTQQILQALNQKMEHQIDDHGKRLNRAMDELVEQSRLAAFSRLMAASTPRLESNLSSIISASHDLSIQLDNMPPHLGQAFDALQRNLQTSINTLGSYTEIATTDLNQDQTQIDLVHTIDHCMKLICDLMASEPNMFTLNTKNDLPISVISSSRCWLQLLMYLTQNVLDHSNLQLNTIAKSIVISVEKTNHHIFVTFSDNGRGMNSEEAAQAFEPFYTTKRHKGHSGLGLFLVQNIVSQKLKGSISLTTNLNQGFSITIKLNL